MLTDPTRPQMSPARVVPQASPMQIETNRMVTTAPPPSRARDEVTATLMQPQPRVRRVRSRRRSREMMEANREANSRLPSLGHTIGAMPTTLRRPLRHREPRDRQPRPRIRRASTSAYQVFRVASFDRDGPFVFGE